MEESESETETEYQTPLVKLCIEVACGSRQSVEKWRRQRRSLERLPAHLADSMLRNLHHHRLLFPSLLEVFKHSVEAIDLRGDNYVNAEWMAYLGAFRYLQSLDVAECHKISSSALWPLAGMTNLKKLNLSRCRKVTDSGIRHLTSISTLEELRISETGVSASGVEFLSSLKKLSVLDLGGLPVTDVALGSLGVLTRLQYIDLWGSSITNAGAIVLTKFPNLSFLNLAWTAVTKLANMSSLECLNLSDCSLDTIIEEGKDKAPLTELSLSGTTFANEENAFMHIETSFLFSLDVSNSSLTKFCFLPQMVSLEHLDVSSTMMGDDRIELIALIGAKLKILNLNKTKVTSAGVRTLAGHLPNLEVLKLSGTPIDDVAISYIGMMPSLKVIDLSNTNVKGFIWQEGDNVNVVLSLEALRSLNNLERLYLEQTKLIDVTIRPLSTLQELSHLYVGSASLTDISLYQLSSLSKLTNLGIQDAVLTDGALNSFKPPMNLKVLDLRGCWLLTEDAILSFSKLHPHIEIKHELVHISQSNQIGSNSTFPARVSSRMSKINRMQEQIPLPEYFLDQRLKYSREELLALQYSSLSLAFHGDSEYTSETRLPE